MTAYFDNTGRIYNVKSYGAVGDGVTDDTAAIAAAYTAAGSGGVVYFPPGTYIRSSATTLVPTTGTITRGSGRSASIISDTAGGTDIFVPAAGTSKLKFEDITVTTTSSSGHIFNPGGSLNTSLWISSQFIQNNPAKSVYNHGDFGYLDNLWVACVLTHNGAASVPTVSIVTNTSGANTNTWERLQCNRVSAGTSPFFLIERDNAATYNYNNTFRDLTFEICNGALIKLLSANGCVIDNINAYDATTTTDHQIIIDAGSGGQASRDNTIRNYHRIGSTLGSGKQDIFLGTSGKAITTSIYDCNQSSGAGISIDFSSNQRCVLIGCDNATTANQHQSTVFVDRGRVVGETIQVLGHAGAPTDGLFNVTPQDCSFAVDTTNNKIYVRIGGVWKGVVVA